MASRGPDRVPRPPLWLPACKVIALRLARSARPGRPLPATQAHGAPDCIVSTLASAQVRASVNDFADPLPPGLGIYHREVGCTKDLGQGPPLRGCVHARA